MGPLIHGIFFNKYIGNFFGDVQQFENKIPFSSLLYYKTIVYNVYNIENMC